MLSSLLYALLCLEPAAVGDAMFVPHVLASGEIVTAIGSDAEYAYTQTPDGLFAWDRRGRRIRLSERGGTRGSSIATDAESVYFIAEEALWQTPKPGRKGRARALAEDRFGLGLAVDGADLFFTHGETSQLFRLPTTGGVATPLLQDGVESQTSADFEEGQSVVVDAGYVYWTFAGRVLRVARAGGSPELVFAAKELRPKSLAAAGDWLYFADGKTTYRLRKNSGLGAQAILDCAAAMISPQPDRLYALCGPDLVRASLDGGQRELLDEGPSDKETVAVVGERVYFSDQDRGTIEPALLVLPLHERQRALASGKPGFDEAALAVRRWIADLGRKDAAPALAAPVRLHFEPDLREGWRYETTVKDAAELARLSALLRAKTHPLLEFQARYAWRLLPAGKIPAGASKAKRRLYRLARKATVLISHRMTGNCPYGEVIVAVARVRGAVLPTEVYFEGGYDCE